MSDEEEYDSERSDSDAEDDGKTSEGDAGKRAYHNLLERKRRDNIKDSFCQLRDVLPHFSKKKKASRVQILKKACDFLRRQKSLEEIEAEAADIEEENRLLEQSIAELNTAVANNDEEAIARLSSKNLPLKRRHYLLEDTDSDDSESSDEDSSSPDPSPVAAASSRRKIKRN